jgi:hypothetical protein
MILRWTCDGKAFAIVGCHDVSELLLSLHRLAYFFSKRWDLLLLRLLEAIGCTCVPTDSSVNDSWRRLNLLRNQGLSHILRLHIIVCWRWWWIIMSAISKFFSNNERLLLYNGPYLLWSLLSWLLLLLFDTYLILWVVSLYGFAITNLLFRWASTHISIRTSTVVLCSLLNSLLTYLCMLLMLLRYLCFRNSF